MRGRRRDLDKTIVDEDRLSTGKFAELNNLSRKTMRLWRDVGLLEPCDVDGSNGYAYYSIEQCGLVDAIQHLQECGLTLGQIKQLHDDGYKGLKEELAERRRAIDDEILNLTVTKRNIDEMLRNFEWIDNELLFDVPIIERIPEQRVITIPVLYPPAAHMHHQIGTFLDDCEMGLRLLKKDMADRGIPMTLFRNVGDRITRENVLSQVYDIDCHVLFPNDRAIEERFANHTIPGGLFLTMCRRSIDVDGRNTEVEGIEELLRFADQHGLGLSGDYWGQVIGETPLYHFSGRGMAVKLLLPVATKA